MFSYRILVVLAVGLAIAAAIPTDRPIPKPVTTISEDDLSDNTWLTFPLFGNFFAPLWKLFPTFYNAGPKIVSDNDKFQVIISVKDYKKSELKVKVRGVFILIQGSHEVSSDTRDIFSSQFFQTFSMPENASSADVTAELTTDKYLVVTAPIKPGSKVDTADREVEITESGKPFKTETTTAGVEDVDDKTQTVAAIAPISDNEDDRKEPTTPAEANLSTGAPNTDLDEATEKDNSIPHGNEVTVL